MGGSAAVTSVAAAIISTELSAPRAGRVGVAVFNDSTATLFLKLGPVASANSFTVKMAAGGYYESPFGYTDQVTGIWDAANGSARVTEVG